MILKKKKQKKQKKLQNVIINSEKEAIATYDKKVKEWGDKWSNGIISYEQYIKNCPSGYETWDCPICHKWTINMYSKN